VGKPPAPSWSNPRGVPAPTATHKPQKSAALVEQLVALLNETKSKETFTVTLIVLQKLGTEAKSAVPAILRNADRLGLFEGALSGDSKGKQSTTDVLDTIDAVLGKTPSPQPSAVPAPATCGAVLSGGREPAAVSSCVP
jgi:hypothetical protein